jgi:ubiquinone/menaquinone biosynthesis C-methylase UbiE
MEITTRAPSAERWGPLWGARAEDWAATEEQQHPTYEEAIRRVGIEPGEAVLEVGCGSGVFLALAREHGARVHGLDASEALVEIARRRVPDAEVRVGAMESLPWEDERFDLVAGFNAFFFADDMVAALREARRVARRGAAVVVQVWGRPERCALDAMKHAVASFLPPPDPKARRGSELWAAGVLEEVASEAGLAPASAFDHSWAYEYADDRALLRGLLAAGGLAVVAERTGRGLVEQAILDGLRPYRTPAGGYRLENEWHYLVATA